MPHLNGRIYTQTSGGVKYGISIYDIQTTIGSGASDIGSLCRHANVQKWSKVKPIRSASLSMPSMADANYGIDIPQNGYGSLSSMISALDGGYSWDYLQPRGKGAGSGGANEWFRFLDFDGYYQFAQAPLGFLQNTQVTVYEDASTASVTIAFTKTPESDPDAVTLGILRPYGGNLFSGLYFGVCLFNQDNTIYCARTQPNTFSSVASAAEISVVIPDVPAPLAGTRVYRAIPFFSTLAITTTITGSSSFLGSLFPIPIVECEASVTKIAVQVMTYVFAYTNVNQTSPLYYRLNINTSVDISGVQYRIIACKNGSGVSSPDDVVVASGSIPQNTPIGNVYVPSDSTWDSVNNTSFNPMVTEENGYTNIRCELRRGELQIGTHSALTIAWGQGSAPFDDV